MNEKTVDRLISLKSAAEILGVSVREFRRRRDQWGLNKHPLSSPYRPRYRLSEIRELVEGKKD